MLSMLSKTLNEQKQPLDNGWYNVPDGTNPELSKGLNIPDGTRRNGSNRLENVPDGTWRPENSNSNFTVRTLTNSNELKIIFPSKHQIYILAVLQTVVMDNQ